MRTLQRTQGRGQRGWYPSLGLVVLGVVLAGCGSGASARSGSLLITPLAGRCGIFAISGTHALLDATGQFCRLRVRVESADSSEHDFSSADQALLLADCPSVLPSSGATSVRRQPPTVPLGPEDFAEVVLWWESPADARVTAVRLVGDRDVPLRGLTPPKPTARP